MINSIYFYRKKEVEVKSLNVTQAQDRTLNFPLKNPLKLLIILQQRSNEIHDYVKKQWNVITILQLFPSCLQRSRAESKPTLPTPLAARIFIKYLIIVGAEMINYKVWQSTGTSPINIATPSEVSSSLKRKSIRGSLKNGWSITGGPLRNVVTNLNIKTYGSTLTQIPRNSRYFLVHYILQDSSQRAERLKGDEGDGEGVGCSCVSSAFYSTSPRRLLNKPPSLTFSLREIWE